MKKEFLTMLFMTATMIPEELLLEKLSEKLEEYNCGKCTLTELAMTCHLIIIKESIGDNPDKMFDMLKKISRVEDVLHLTDIDNLS